MAEAGHGLSAGEQRETRNTGDWLRFAGLDFDIVSDYGAFADPRMDRGEASFFTALQEQAGMTLEPARELRPLPADGGHQPTSRR